MHKSCLEAREGRLVSSVVNCFFYFAYVCAGVVALNYCLNCLRENIISWGVSHKMLQLYKLFALRRFLCNAT